MDRLRRRVTNGGLLVFALVETRFNSIFGHAVIRLNLPWPERQKSYVLKLHALV